LFNSNYSLKFRLKFLLIVYPSKVEIVSNVNSTTTYYPKQDLIEGLKNKKLISFEEFYDCVAPVLYGDIKRSLFREDVSVETLQKVFVQLYSSIDSFDASKERFFTWAIKIVRKEVRKQKTELVLKELFLCQRKSNLVQHLACK
jgi:RNA polymerase sigma-70 factor (ECF subfamily)